MKDFSFMKPTSNYDLIIDANWPIEDQVNKIANAYDSFYENKEEDLFLEID